MKYVRLTLDANGREAEIHPMYDLLVNASYIDRATAMHWNYSGTELGIMHYIDGDPEAFSRDIDEIPEVIDYELTIGSERSFYAYVRDATNESLRAVFDQFDRGSVVSLPPIEYRADGTLAYSIVGPADAVSRAIEGIPEPIAVTVEEVGGLAAAPGVLEATLSDRQQEAIEAAVELGYYEIPREAGHEDVARAIGCAPSTAAEHLQKAESKLLRSVLRS